MIHAHQLSLTLTISVSTDFRQDDNINGYFFFPFFLFLCQLKEGIIKHWDRTLCI